MCALLMLYQRSVNEYTTVLEEDSVYYFLDRAKYSAIGDLVSKETLCCVGGKVKH